MSKFGKKAHLSKNPKILLKKAHYFLKRESVNEDLNRREKSGQQRDSNPAPPDSERR